MIVFHFISFLWISFLLFFLGINIFFILSVDKETLLDNSTRDFEDDRDQLMFSISNVNTFLLVLLIFVFILSFFISCCLGIFLIHQIIVLGILFTNKTIQEDLSE